MPPLIAAGVGTAATASTAIGAATAAATASTVAAATGTAVTTGTFLTQALLATTAITGAAGAVMQGQAADRAGKFNQAQLNEQARQEAEAAGLRASERRRLAREQISTSRALLAADGADTTAGQPLLIQTETAAEGDFQARLDQFDGDRRAGSLRQRGRLERRSGRQARFGGFVRAGTSLLNSVPQGDFF